MNAVQLREDVMTMIAIENAPAARTGADVDGFPDTPEYMTGFIETVRSGGLRLAGYEAWAAVVCGLIALACLVGVARLAAALINPVMEAVIPMNCASSMDCALQTIGMIP
jgi:hypothetical protein